MKYQSSKLSQEKALQLWLKLHEAMEKESINWRKDISHYELAEEMGTNRNYISRVVNQVACLTIPNYINIYRVNAFQCKLKNGELEYKTVEGLGMEVGFKSKATLYRVVNEIYGTSPMGLTKNLKLNIIAQ